ncbi:hypothetical protein SAV31267_083700 [Streptomyces avermitilis]|uniref:Major facilitator superfamily (MFS) profile domain-containing protein n=1 Tax=Streptomyces avermitilis TaxID=33903 RepID=A0A4D4N5N9_STRAX|nr:hypothetical protein SAV31267_083700 [Streptomyces avermitilis]
MAAGVTTLLDQSVLNIAVPALRQSLEAGSTDVQWIVAGYSLTFGLMLVPGGSLGDVHGRKGLFLVGLSVFVLFGVIAATGVRPEMVIAARLMQGAGAGLVNSQVIGTLQDVFTGQDRARALGLYAVTGGLAAALGPALGGTLVAAFGPELGWRLCLLLSTPCGVITLWLAALWLPRARRPDGRSRLDWWGLLWVGALTLTLMLPFISTPSSGGEAALWAGAAVVLTACFVLGQRLRVRAGRAPLVHPSLARSLPYTLGTAVAMASFGSSLAATLVLTMFLQSGLGLSAPAAALVTLPAALAMGARRRWRGARSAALGRTRSRWDSPWGSSRCSRRPRAPSSHRAPRSRGCSPPFSCAPVPPRASPSHPTRPKCSSTPRPRPRAWRAAFSRWPSASPRRWP